MIDLFLSNFKGGVYHVLNINAYHHILFLIVLTVPYLFKDWKRVLVLITIFTLGHCVALALTVYNVINVNSKLIGFLMPMTIFVIALYNIFTAGKKAQNEKIGLLFFISLFYGLVHGLGFEATFNSMITASENKPIALLEIALGLEVGQFVVAFIVVFLSFLCQTIFRFSKRDWVMVISAIVLGFVLPMLLRHI
jgi:hypothetical protein